MHNKISKRKVEELFPQLQPRFALYGTEPIGQPSGMGLVWKARDTWLEKYVAIKISDQDLTPEIQLCHDIEGQTVRVYEYFRGQGDWNGFVMELLEMPWCNLSKYISAHKYKENDLQHCFDCFEIAKSLLKGLKHIHGRPYSREGRYVHADIKPDNLFVLLKPKKFKNTVFRMPIHDEVVKIIDLGITTENGNRIKGKTFSYAHPTLQVARHGNDLYSLAIVFLEMLMGEQPDHDDLTSKKGVQKILNHYASGSSYIDNIVLEFTNSCVRAATQSNITASKLIDYLDDKLFEVESSYLLALKAINELDEGARKGDIADILFESLADLYGWQRTSENRRSILKGIIEEMYGQNMLVRRSQTYFVR